MIKQNKLKLLISSVIILLPIVVGGILWSRLPEQLAVHWGTDGTADNFSSKAFVVIGLPLILLLLHWVCVLVTAKDPKNKNQNRKVFGLVLWICPVLSLFTSAVIYTTALGFEPKVSNIALALIGIMFLCIGNYLPKCKQNSTIGIKVKWALQNEANWNATHRFGGKVWVAGGLALVICAFLPQAVIPWISIAVLVIIAALPVIYSYKYYKNN
ncbi:MAG: SdpI family protein [Clostridia bacterium]|nr:SdpI family protein [Clostridia bacterium]